MGASVEGNAEELELLRRCVTNLTSLLALPATCSGCSAAEIVRLLADELFGMLRLDFVYVRMSEADAEAPVEVVRLARSLPQPAPREIGEAFEIWLREDPRNWPSRIANPAGEGDVEIVALRFGLDDELGTLVAGSRRATFPQESERLLLRVAASQAVIPLQQTRHEAERRRLADELEARVLHRTAALASANETLMSEIAERRRGEEVLRTSESTLRKIIDMLPATAWSTLPDGHCDFLNQRWLDYAGVSAEQVVGWGWQVVIHPDDLPGLLAHWRKCLASGSTVDTEARMRRSDGEYRWFLFRANTLRDEDGNIVKWYGTNIDIEDRKRAQEELRRSEREARLMVDCIPAHVAVLGAGGEIEQVNRRMADFFGDRVEALGNWKTGDIVPPEELPLVLAEMKKAFETSQPFLMENHLRRFDGVYRWFQVRGFPLMDASGCAVRWYFLLVDIEERKQAEEALRRSEAFLAAAQRISSTGSFSWGLDTAQIVFSEELYRIFELDADADVTLEAIRMRVHSDDLRLLFKWLARARRNDDKLEYEMRLRMPDGRIKYIRTFGHVIHHPDARRECLGVVQDVTERHLSDLALDEARAELTHVTRSMTLGALTASIAHEVNQPLSGVVTNATTCVRMLTADPPNVGGALETARRTIRDGKRAADVIARLRALFGKKAVASETVDLNDAAREVISLLSSDLARSRVVVRAELDDDPLLVTGDRVQIQQVILNLVRNAAEAMSTVEDRPRRLLISTQRDETEHVRLIVQDVGIGFEPGGAERVFDAFYTTKSDSMGMGLSISRSIIERHRGRLWAVSNDGPGTTFAFSIPCSFEGFTGASRT